MRLDRRNILYIIIGVSLVLCSACDTASNVEPVYKDYFIKYYGEDGDQQGKDFVVNPDGTIVILGTSTTMGSKRMYVAKTDLEGEIIWERKLGSSSNNEVAQDIEMITAGPDIGRYAVLSNVTKSIADSLAIRITILSPDGDSLKSTLINRFESQKSNSITPLSDGSYFVAGNVINADTLNVDLPITDYEDILVIKLNSTLTPTDFFRIGGSSLGSAIKIFENGANFNYAGYSDELTGEPGAVSDYENNFFFRQFIDNPGSVSSSYAGNSTQHEILSSIAKSPSGSFLAIGTQLTSGGPSRFFAAKIIGSSFTKIEEGVFGSSEELEGVAVAPSGTSEFLVLANKVKPGGRDIWLAKVGITISTAPKFTATFGASNNDDTASEVAELPNGDIVILGTMNLVNQNKIALIKLKANGEF